MNGSDPHQLVLGVAIDELVVGVDTDESGLLVDHHGGHLLAALNAHFEGAHPGSSGACDHCSGGHRAQRRNAAPDAQEPTRPRYADALQDTLAALPCPVLVDADVGHRPPQLLLINGGLARVRWSEADGGSVTLSWP